MTIKERKQYRQGALPSVGPQEEEAGCWGGVGGRGGGAGEGRVTSPASTLLSESLGLPEGKRFAKRQISLMELEGSRTGEGLRSQESARPEPQRAGEPFTIVSVTFSSLCSWRSGWEQRPWSPVTQGLVDDVDTNDSQSRVMDAKGLGAGGEMGEAKVGGGALPQVLRGSGSLVYNQPPMRPTQDPAGPSERINFRHQDTHVPSIVREETRAHRCPYS